MGSQTLDQLSAALEIAAEQAGKKILVIDTPLDIINYAVREGLIDRLEPLILGIPTKVYVHDERPPMPDMAEISAKIAVEGREERESRPFHFRTKADRRKALKGKKR